MRRDSDRIEQGRWWLKDLARQEVDFSSTGQSRGCPVPPIQQPVPPDAVRVALPRYGEWPHVRDISIVEAIARRESRRQFASTPLELDELAFLLWAVQGVRKVVHRAAVLRTVPSAGARHPFETYVAVLRIAGLVPGVYRYLPLEHELARLRTADARALSVELARAALGQLFVGYAAAVFIWTAIPYRTEWRYGVAAHKVIALDAGHVAQNLYIACEAIEGATCAVAAYDQVAMDRLVGVDGREEFVIYLAPVGHRRSAEEE